MKKIISIATSLGLLFTPPVFAQESEDPAVVNEEEEYFVPPPPKPINSSDLQNWLFAAGSLVTATLAILLVAWSPGSPPSHSDTN